MSQRHCPRHVAQSLLGPARLPIEVFGPLFALPTTTVEAMNEIARDDGGSTSTPGDSWSTDSGIWAVVVAGGSGSRFGGLKQFSALGGRSVIDWAVAGLGCPGRSVVVVPADQVDGVQIEDAMVVAGGSTRSASVREGLASLPPTADRVLIHDGARPLATPELVGRVVAALDGADGAVPVVPVTDTIRTIEGEPADRSNFVAVQTPQGFWLSAIRDALGDAEEATDDATLVTRAGGRVVHVDGDPSNLKVTVPDDLAVAEAILARRAAASLPS